MFVCVASDCNFYFNLKRNSHTLYTNTVAEYWNKDYKFVFSRFLEFLFKNNAILGTFNANFCLKHVFKLLQRLLECP